MQHRHRSRFSHPNRRGKNTGKKITPTRRHDARRQEAREIAWMQGLEARQLMSAVVDDIADLTVFGTQSGQRAGITVASWANNIAIGSYLTDIGAAFDAGAVYIRDATTGALLSTIQKATPAGSDLFGQA